MVARKNRNISDIAHQIWEATVEQRPANQVEREFAYQIPPDSGPLKLTKDVIVEKGYKVLIDGGGNTVKLVGLNRFNVETGGKLCLFNMHIIPYDVSVRCPSFLALVSANQPTAMPQTAILLGSLDIQAKTSHYS